MQPGLSGRRFAFLKLSLGALDSIKFVFGSINFIFSKQLILCTDHASHRWQLLNLDTWSLGYKFTLEDTVNANSFIITEWNWLGPCKAFLKKNMLEVSLYERILNWITIVIKRLHHVFTPTFAKSKGSAKEYLIVLNQAQDNSRVQSLKFQSHFRPHLSLYLILRLLVWAAKV